MPSRIIVLFLKFKDQLIPQGPAQGKEKKKPEVKILGDY